MNPDRWHSTLSPARRVALLATTCALLAAGWLAIADPLLPAAFADAQTPASAQTVALWLLVPFGAILFLAFSRRHFAALDKELQRLQGNEARMRAIIASIDDLVFVFDSERRYIEINQPESDALYLPPSDFLGRRIDEIGLPAEIAAQFEQVFTQIERGEKPASFVYSLHVPAGKRWFSARVSPYNSRDNDSHGQTGGFTAVIRDITETRLAELAVSDERNFSRRLIDSLPGLVFVFDPDGRLLLWNQGLEQLTGYRADQLDRISALSLFSYSAREIVEAHIRRVIEHGYDEGEALIRHKDRSQHPFYLRARRFEMGGRTALLCIGTDLGLLKAAEARLRESESRFRSLFERVPCIAVQGYDRQRRVIFWNAASEALYGYPAAEALGRKLEELIIPPEARAQVVADIERWLTTGEAVPPGPLALRHRDGHSVHVFSSHVMQRNIAGEEELYCLDIDFAPCRQPVKKAGLAAGKFETLPLDRKSHE